ncbi:microfibril-associated glycoprotein 4-like [Physella acuta]|uniref:microfibril-associated glycoprotein 4-like n=1 Tax=Physella acuta TaxID=109671 RepID=UPI0027DB772D|nr:microfibril-associated glycoprotein 4-like [Physella acuta]
MVQEQNLLMLPINVEYSDVSHLSCASRCTTSNKTCYSYIYDGTTRHCTLGSWLVLKAPSDPVVQGKIYSTGKFCNTTSDKMFINSGRISSTELFFCSGDLIDTSPHPPSSTVHESCKDVVSPESRPVAMVTPGCLVICDTVTDGGGWTIFQRRVSGTVDFYRNWTEYKNGFGNFSSGNFYLGNENIYLITSKRQHELRVDLTLDGVNYFAKYSSFSITSEADGYRLQVSGYSGTAGDSLSYHNLMMFSTYDQDNDLRGDNCASVYHGACWYKDCYYSNLNGDWGSTSYTGVFWKYDNRIYIKADFSEMKYRYV